MGIRDSLRRTLEQHGWRASRRGLIAGLVVFLLLAGTGTAYAVWTASATATSTSSAATLTLTSTNFTTNAYTFRNHQLTTTGTLTITNTTDTVSSTAAGLSVAFNSAGGSAVMAAGLELRVWPNTVAACTAATPVSATSGTWASFPAVTGSLAKTAAITYCVRSYISDRSAVAAAAGTLTFQPRAVATLSVGNFVASATVTTTQDTQYIYSTAAPDQYTWYTIKNTGTGQPCLDVYNNDTASGTPLIEWPCKTAAEGNLNQLWRVVSAGSGYYDVQPKSTTALRWDTNSSTTDGGAVQVVTNNDPLLSQQWQLQTISAGVYQFVNNLSGMCLEPRDTAVTAAVEYAQSACDGATAQRFTLTAFEAIPHVDTISCANTGTTGTTRRVAYTWTPIGTQTYSVQYRLPGATGAWTQIATTASGVGTYTWATGAGTPGTDGNYDVRVVVGTDTAATNAALITDSVWRGTGSAGSYLRCERPTPAIAAVTCANTGTTLATYRISYSWAEEAVGPYTLQIQAANGTWSTFGTIAAGATSIAVNPAAGNVPLTWVAGTYNARILDGATVLATTTFYRGGTTTPYLRCDSTPVIVVVAMTCSAGNYTQTATFTWPAQVAGTYRLQSRNAPADAWTTLETTTSTTTATIDRGDFPSWTNGEKNVQLLNSNNDVVGTGTFEVATIFTFKYLTC